ncbi:MAG TPA: four-helix bundle copper-binding protein [Noviherbaspirillum sp.]|nr:four-helix bundle copper-binding protein [Noviherbaspirillum sp.]
MSLTASDPSLVHGADECLRCYQACQHTAMNHCLEMGGHHTEPEHFRLMMNCAEICRSAAHFMLSGSPLYASICNACADMCNACAESCEQLGDMKECVAACRACEQSCRQVASAQPAEMLLSASRGSALTGQFPI